MRQIQRIIRRNACDPPFACNVRRRPVQVAIQARTRHPVSPPSAQHSLAAGRLVYGCTGVTALLVWITRIWPNLLDLSPGGEAGDDPAVASRRGRTATTRCPTMREDRHNANSVRIASSLRPDMIFRRDSLLLRLPTSQ